MPEFDLYLASQSPRRRELLTQIGISYEVLQLEIDESVKSNELVEDYVVRLAKEKALAVWPLRQDTSKPVLGSDTSVVIHGDILGKPENEGHALEMLTRLSGQTHKVMSAVALACNATDNHDAELNYGLSVSNVTFSELSSELIKQYIASGECFGKAGAYAIQGRAAAFIRHLSGSYSGVMGLPLYETAELLQKAGISSKSLVVS